MGTRRFAGLAVAVAALALAVGACGSDDESSGGSSASSGGGGGDKPYIAIVSKGFQHQFWQAVKQGAEQEAKAEGARITFEGPPTEQDIEQQVTMLTNALQKNPDAAMAGATPYLRLFGLTSGGVYLARGALAAARNGGRAEPIAIARFFAENIASAAPGLKETVVGGADSTLMLKPEALSA